MHHSAKHSSSTSTRWIRRTSANLITSSVHRWQRALCLLNTALSHHEEAQRVTNAALATRTFKRVLYLVGVFRPHLRPNSLTRNTGSASCLTESTHRVKLLGALHCLPVCCSQPAAISKPSAAVWNGSTVCGATLLTPCAAAEPHLH